MFISQVTETTDARAIERMTLKLFLRDRATAEHTSRVAGYVRVFAEALGYTPEHVATLETAAVLHDLGKIAVPDCVLLKPAALTCEERTIVREHASVGAEMVAEVESLRPIAEMVRHHHERMDGTGYPDRLSGEAIPLGARIIAIADTYDAITSERPYRSARAIEIAIAELEAGAGTQFDAQLVDVFVDLARRGLMPIDGTVFAIAG